MAMRCVVLALLAVLGLLGQAEAATPIDRVISLMSKLRDQVEREGKKEAAEYDKFACYCKEQADDTQYAIEKSTALIKSLKAAIEKLDADIEQLEADIKELAKTIKEKEADIKAAVKKRKKENDAYKKEAEEIADAIEAIAGAIKALKDSKKDMKKTKVSLLQDQLLEVLSLGKTPPTEAQIRAIESLAQAPPSSAKNHAYVYRSNDIIGTLETLSDQFKEKKKEANVAEKESLFAFEEKKQALENEKFFAEKDKTEKENLNEEKKADRADKKKDKEAEEKDLKADQGYLDDVTAECETKAKEWDERSEVRSGELTALNSAITTLKEGVNDNYQSNQLAAGASFLQMRGSSSSVALGRAMDLIGAEAKRLNSQALSGLAVKLRLKGGPFASVTKLVDDLIKKLEDEAKAAEKSKSFCADGMKKAMGKRDKNQLEMEDAEATIALKKAEKVSLSSDIGQLNKEVAELNKSLLEASELRSEEKANNKVTLADAEAGKKAVDDAIEVLKDFYGGQAFLQRGPNRDGVDFKKSAPELSYKGKYKGKQEASKGIIGILEMIAEDFQRTLSDTKAAEKSAQEDFDSMEKTTQDDLKDKTKLIKEKRDAIKKADGKIVDAKDSMMDANKLMETAIKELEALKVSCFFGESSFAEKKKQREEEIKALKGAKKVLEDMK